jgi:hypothetical protein
MTTRTQPSYPSVVKKPRARLKAQVTPREITTETPVLLYDGSSNANGAVITQGNITHLGNNVATVVRLYSRLANSSTYDLLVETTVPVISGSTDALAITSVPIELFNISPNNATPSNKGFRIEAGESIYVALGTAIAAGVNVFLEVQEY